MKTVTLLLEGLHKTYPNGKKAVNNVSLEVRPGEVFGLVGPNGAGKSTLLKLAAGLLYPEKGKVYCGETEVTSRAQKAADYIALMPDPLGVYTDVSSAEYLEFYARAYGLEGELRRERIDQAVKLLGLEPWLQAEVETLSAGWQRRLALGRVLIADPPILILDEPAAGLDVTARLELLQVVRNLASLGKSMVVSSHILPELEQLADRFGILNEGSWMEIAPGKTFLTREEIRKGLRGVRYLVRTNDAGKLFSLLQAEGLETEKAEGGLEVVVADETAAAALLEKIVGRGIAVHEFRCQQRDLTGVVVETLEKKA